MSHWLVWFLYTAAAVCAIAGLRGLWLLAQTPAPEPAPGEVHVHFSVGEATPRGDRLRLTSAILFLLAAALAVVARKIT